jgi:hypothetical protein
VPGCHAAARHPNDKSYAGWRRSFPVLVSPRNLLDRPRVKSPAKPAKAAPMDNSSILEAIALRRCLGAQYNKLDLVLAPHVLYRRNDSYFIDAITITRDGAEPREPKVGSYNLAGLSALKVLDASFDIHPLFNRMDPKYSDNTMFMIDAD